MSIALTQLRTPVTAKALGLAVAALALGAGATIGSVATAAHQPLPTVTTQAPADTATQDSAGTTDGTDSTGNTTTTDSANSNAFGQQVVQQVNSCKTTAAASATHGIGQCVSGWVTTHNPGSSHHTH